MKMKINEVAKLTGITARTLHYYDEIGLLSPSETTQAGYRLYDDMALSHLQQILFFRELDFPLNQIKEIVTNPAFDASNALQNHKALLTKKRERIDKLIALVDKTIKGGSDMSFKDFDTSEIEVMKEKYAEEAKEKWGHTDAYSESMNKTKQYDAKKWQEIQKKQSELFKLFAKNTDKQPDHPNVQKLVKQWQNFISDNFYTCTNEALHGLGQMYVADARFTKNIDKHSEGLAAFISKAIDCYCNQQ